MPATTPAVPMDWPTLSPSVLSILADRAGKLREMADAEDVTLPPAVVFRDPSSDDPTAVRVSHGYGFVRIGYGPRYVNTSGDPLDVPPFVANGKTYAGPVGVMVYDDGRPSEVMDGWDRLTASARERIVADAERRAALFAKHEPATLYRRLDATDALERAALARDRADAIGAALDALAETDAALDALNA